MLKNSVIAGDKGYHAMDNKEFGKHLINFLNSTVYQHDINYIRYLAWTNKSVESWCTGLRRVILPNEHQQQVIEGEKLIGYTTISDYRTGEIFLQNSENYTVIELKDDVSNDGIKGKIITLSGDEGRENSHFLVRPESYDLFKEIAYEKWKAATTANYKERGKRWGIFYTFKNNHLIMSDINHRGMKITKDLYYASGSTVHKSQGSTFGNTAVNVRDIRRNGLMHEQLRLLYVALSRAQNTNLILVK